MHTKLKRTLILLHVFGNNIVIKEQLFLYYFKRFFLSTRIVTAPYESRMEKDLQLSYAFIIGTALTTKQISFKLNNALSK